MDFNKLHYANMPKNVKQANYESQTQKNSQVVKYKFIPAHQWRVVCDSMLGGLTNKLRMCGCDCAHFTFDQEGERSAQLAMREKRVLLTRNKGYLRVGLN